MATTKNMGRQIGNDSGRDLAEDAHFRLDELERSLPGSEQYAAGIAQGALAAMSAQHEKDKAEIIALVMAKIEENRALDRALDMELLQAINTYLAKA